LELGRVPTTAEVSDEVSRLKAQHKKDKQEAKHARFLGGAEQLKKLDNLDTLLR
jgi:hypothetical protein